MCDVANILEAARICETSAPMPTTTKQNKPRIKSTSTVNHCEGSDLPDPQIPSLVVADCHGSHHGGKL
jgi:hypothetical protein